MFARGVHGGSAAGEAERIARALHFYCSILTRKNRVPFGRLGFVRGQVDGDGADVSLAAEAFQKRVRHHQMAVVIRVNPILAGQVIILAELLLGLGHHRNHRIEHVGVCDSLLVRDFLSAISIRRSGGEGFVIHVGVFAVVIVKGPYIDRAR